MVVRWPDALAMARAMISVLENDEMKALCRVIAGAAGQPVDAKGIVNGLVFAIETVRRDMPSAEMLFSAIPRLIDELFPVEIGEEAKDRWSEVIAAMNSTDE